MAIIGRKTLKSERARMHGIDVFFARIAQVILLVFLAFTVIVSIFENTSLRIVGIQIEGAHALAEKDLSLVLEQGLHHTFLFRIRRDNTMLYPERQTLATLHAMYPRIADAHIDFPDRHTLRLSLREYVPRLLYCMTNEIPSVDSLHAGDEDVADVVVLPPANDATSTSESIEGTTNNVVFDRSCYHADEKGYVFSVAPLYSGYPFLTITAPTTTDPLPVPIGHEALASDAFTSVMDFVAALRSYDFETHEIILLSEGDVELRTNMPWGVLWSTEEDPIESARNLNAVVSGVVKDEKDVPKVIDLRFGNKIFYK